MNCKLCLDHELRPHAFKIISKQSGDKRSTLCCVKSHSWVSIIQGHLHAKLWTDPFHDSIPIEVSTSQKS